MNVRATEPRESKQPRGSAMKFTYPSGSRPLDGYEIKRGIGQGGFGEVYFARSDGGKEVALKLIRRDFDVELRGVSQCLNLKHPNLVAIHDVRQDQHDDYWVIMECVADDCLQDVIDRNPNGMPVDEVLDWMHGIAAGVAYLHDKGIVHRDLKPGNIFRDEGIVKIGDYGLAKIVSTSRRSGQTESVGTVSYMAPEIANGCYGKEIDTYALGVLLYEMFTGHVPFEGESVGEVLMKHLTAEPDLSKLEEPYRTAVARALAKDPAARPKSVSEWAALLPPPPPDGAASHAYLGSGSRGRGRSPDVPSSESNLPRPPVTVPVEIVDENEEPVWRLIRDTFRQLNEQWTNAPIHPALKVIILLAAAFMLLTNAGWLFPMMFLATMTYGVYRVIRAMVVPSSRAKIAPPKRSAELPPTEYHENSASDRCFKRRRSWRTEQIAGLSNKPLRQRLTELSGSMLLAGGVAVIMTVVMMVLRGQPILPNEFAWLSIVGTFGAWAIMLPAKFWEGERGEQAPRRFTLLCLGLLLGASAYGLTEYLMVDLRYEMITERASLHTERYFSDEFYNVDGSPGLPIFFAYFGFLYLLLRWWRQADPARGTRFSLWSVAVCVFWAWLLGQFWNFPQPWGFMTAAIIAVSVQLASPWVPLRGKENRTIE